MLTKNLIVRKLIFVLCFISIPAMSATKITLNCMPPTTRVDGSVFSSADIGGYLFQMTEPAKPLAALGAAQTCSYIVNIAPNTCIKAGTIFGASVSDTLGVWSDPGTTSLMADACNALPKPSKPTVTITVQ